MSRYFFLLAIVALLFGCETVSNKVTNFMGGEDNAKPPTPLEDITQKVAIKKLWDKNTGSGTDEQYLKLVPVYHQNKLFVADNDGEVSAIDAATGKKIWERDTDSPITGGPGVGGSLVVVGTGKAEVIALSVDSGEIIWKTRVTSEVLASPRVSGNFVVVRTIDGKIFGLNVEDGKRIWVYDRAVPTLTLRGTSAPVIVDDFVIAGFDEGRLTEIELQTGKLVWETRIALGTGRSELDRMVDIDSEPVISDDTIYVATFQGRIAALSLVTGRILWTREISSYAGICVDDKAVYITDDDSAIWALDKNTGASIWKQEKLVARALTAPESYGNMIAVGDLEGYVHWLNKDTGEIVARKQVADEKILAAPLAVDNIIYTYGSNGVLGAYTTDQLDIKTSVSDKPADGADKPADGADKPADGADKPADDADKPADDADKPADDAVSHDEDMDNTSDQETAVQTEDEEQQTAPPESPESDENTDTGEKGFWGKIFDKMLHDDEEDDNAN